MKYDLSIITLTILCFFLLQQNVFGQARSFTYGGSSGSRNGGKVTIQYFLKNGGRLQKLESNVIDLNSYGSSVRLIIQFSELEVGLKRDGTGIKDSNHYNRYYLRALHQKSSILSPSGKRDIRISAEGKGGGIGELTGQLVYKIHPVTEERHTVIKIKTEIIDSNRGRRWNAIPITISFTLLPRASDIENSAWRPIQQLWEKVAQKPNEEDKRMLLEQCLEYRNNCEQQTFSCRYKEEALYYIIMLTDSNKRGSLIKKYKEEYSRKGKYLEELSEMPEVTEPDVPIEAGARLDYDHHYLIVNDVKGGKKPYWVKFFDRNTGDSIALKSMDFAKDYVFIDFKSLKIEGLYTVKVTDKNGQVFVENDRVAVHKALQWHASIKLSGILLLLAGLGFAYKKFIHF